MPDAVIASPGLGMLSASHSASDLSFSCPALYCWPLWPKLPYRLEANRDNENAGHGDTRQLLVFLSPWSTIES